MQGWRLFKYSVLMIFQNLPVIFKISWFPILCYGVAIGLYIYSLGMQISVFPGDLDQLTRYESDLGVILKFGLLWLFSALLAVWGVVAWHRFVLLEEPQKGWIPAFNVSAMGKYIWQVILLVLVLSAMAVPVAVLLLATASAAEWFGIALLLVAGILTGAVFTQLAMTLPAVALEKPISLHEAWEASVDDFWQIVILVLLVIVFQFAADWVNSKLVLVPVLNAGLSLVSSTFFAMLNVSILTTMYGVYVEGRSID